MPPTIAALIFILLILYLFWVDRKKNDGVSKAIWIPLIWMVFAASREISFWIHYWFNIELYSASIEEGNPIERVFHTVLIAAGVVILIRRRLNWKKLFRQNSWIWLYFIFAALSFIWSDYPFVSFKRWIKTLGAVIMVLVILTEDRPYDAIGIILRHIAFLLLPLSVLFIKYYPSLGKAYHHFTGTSMYTGVASQKNGLGAICLISSIYFFWKLLLNRKGEMNFGHRLHFSIYLIVFPMIAWLLYMANSATSSACVVLAVCLFLVARLPAFAKKPRRIVTFGIVCIVLFGIMDLAFDVEGTIITMLGRRSDLTTRVPMWEDLLSMVKNPIVGYGYESFWLGERRDIVKQLWGVDRQAHNGYLQMYLDLGFIGLFFLLGWLLSGLRKVHRNLAINYPAAMLKLCFIVVAALYNWTEAALYGMSIMLVLLLFGIMDIPSQQQSINKHMHDVIQE